MRALWAIDPFGDDKNRLKQMHGLLKCLVPDSSCIDVGYVVGRLDNGLNLALDIPENERYSVHPRKVLKKLLSDARVVVKDGNILVEDSKALSTSKAVDHLLSIAKSRSSDLVALHTHAREGLPRFILGSFAESVIHNSRVSLLIVNPKTKISNRLKRVLYASDFGTLTKKHLKKVLIMCKVLKSDLIIFHQAQLIYGFASDETSSEVRSYRSKVNEMQKWIETECNKAGIAGKVIVDSESKVTSGLILKKASKLKADLIVVNAKVGSFAALMGGSVTRQVVRASQLPVLVLK